MGCDFPVLPLLALRINFNPRSPNGLRLQAFMKNEHGVVDFNPRSPNGLRQPLTAAVTCPPLFQSTQPEWAATESKRH